MPASEITITDLWNAILKRNGSRFLVLYQPIVCPKDRTKPERLEALLRFQYYGNVLSIAPFLDQVVRIPSLAEAIDMMVVSEIMNHLSNRHYSINLFPQSLTASFCKWLLSFGHRTNITFEVTERSALTQENLYYLAQIAHHYPVWLDDVGTGFNDVRLIQTGIFSGLKLSGLAATAKDKIESKAIVAGYLKIAEMSGLSIVIEEIETEEQLETMRSYQQAFAPKADLWLQGYAISHPKKLR